MNLKMAHYLTACIVIASTVVHANPTTRDMTKPLATHNTIPESAASAAAIYEICIAAEKFVLQSEETLAKKGPDALQAKLLGTWKSKVNQGIRDAEILRLMGEPASADMLMRLNDYTTRLNNVIVRYWGTRAGTSLGHKIQAQLQKQAKSRDREYEKIRGMAEAKNFVEAEKAINQIAMELDEVIHFIGPQERQPFLVPYTATRGMIDPAMMQIRSAEANQKMTQAIDAMKPDEAMLSTWVDTAAGQLRSAGKATLEGKGEATGPLVLEALSEKWGAGHAAYQRIQGIRWALKWHRDGATVGYGDTTQSESDPTYSEASAWTKAVLSAIPVIIKADAESIQPGDVALRHQQYLAALAKMASLGESKAVMTAGNDALQSLLAKNSVYETSIKNYEAATRDLFTFQSRIIKETAAVLTQQYGPVDAVVREASRAVGTNPGLYPENPTVPVSATLNAPAHLTLASIGPRIVGKKAQVTGVLRISPTSQTSAVEFVGRTYGTIPAITLPESQIRQLKEDLLVDDAHPPLTFAAAKAIQSVTLGNYSAAGGTLAGAQIEMMITRFAPMSPAASIIVPRGGVIGAGTSNSMMNQVAVRIDLDPAWIQHDLGIYRIPGK